MKKLGPVLLRGSWQTKNIGDIAHTPGFLSLARKYLPEMPVYLWPCAIDRGVREMLLANFPGLRIVETEAEIEAAFRECSLLIHGSCPMIDLDGVDRWRRSTGKPYGCFGISADGLWSRRKQEICSDAAFIFCRDSLSEHFLRAQNLSCPVLGFTPDATFHIRLNSDSEAAAGFLSENGLERGRFVCVIPRLRWTPSSFDDAKFYYKDAGRERVSLACLEPDLEKLRETIAGILETTDLKVLICPEMTYQVPMGRRYLYEPLPEKIKEKVVLKREYWITDEAQTVYAAAHSLVSMEMHSPIIFITAGKPAILLRQAEDTLKGQMWRDIGLQDWILELNVSGTEEISRHVFGIINSYPEALRQAEKARENADRAAAAAFRKIRTLI